MTSSFELYNGSSSKMENNVRRYKIGKQKAGDKNLKKSRKSDFYQL